MSDLLGLFDDEDMHELLGKKQQKFDNTKSRKKESAPLNKETLVHMNKRVEIGTGEYSDFTEELYPYSLNFYDFEVFKYDWCVVIINPVEKCKTIIWNDRQALIDYYKDHKKEIWVGYNSRNYDTFILKGILVGMDPKKINDEIIINHKKGWQISDKFRKYPLYDFDITQKMQSLKQLEGFMGNDIRETSVPFDLDRQLNEDEVKETVFYCEHDVEQTIEVFRRRKEVYDSQINLIETFDLSFDKISLTQAQLTAEILECEKQEHNDEFDIQVVPTVHLKNYRSVKEWFMNPDNKNYEKSLNMKVCGVPHDFGWGGVHGAPDEPIFRKGKIYHVDVTLTIWGNNKTPFTLSRVS